MSGILAIFHTDGAPVAQDRLAAMAQAMDYRGPDGIALHRRGHVGLGHCALHTRNTEYEAAQPLASDDDRHVIVFDGYLLNGADLRSDLSSHGVMLHGKSDAELALHAYRQWGEDCAARMEGEFAFALWDDMRQQLFCARDHQSMRPLTWHWDGTTLLVASDIGGVVAGLDCCPPPNLGYLAEQVANEWHTQDETAWQGVRKLLPASKLVLAKGDRQPRVTPYWQVPLEVTIRYPRDEDYFEHYRAMLDEAVCGAAASNRTLGFDVSGGLDSSAVFCLADRALREGRLDAPGLHGVALCGAEGDRSDERKYFRAVGDHTGRPVAEVGLFEPGLDWFHAQGKADMIPPFAPNAAMMISVHEEMARAGCRVALTGHGGDKWLNGTLFGYRQALKARDWIALSAQLQADRHGRGLGQALFMLARQGIAPLAPEAVRRGWQRYRPRRKDPLRTNFWLVPELQRELRDRQERRRAMLEAYPSEHRFKIAKASEPFDLFANEIVNLLGARRQIEYRNPMLSRRFVEFSARTPEHIRLRGGVKKFVHRQAMRGIIPDAVMQRQGKAAFNSSFRRLHPQIRQYCDQQLAAQPSPCVKMKEVGRLFADQLGTSADTSPIWEVWGVFAHLSFLMQAGRRQGGGIDIWNPGCSPFPDSPC